MQITFHYIHNQNKLIFIRDGTHTVVPIGIFALRNLINLCLCFMNTQGLLIQKVDYIPDSLIRREEVHVVPQEMRTLPLRSTMLHVPAHEE